MQPDLFTDIQRKPRPIRAEQVDICAGRHGGSATSQAANLKVNKQKDAAKVLEIIKNRRASYLKQIAVDMNKFPNAISGRLTWLKVNGYIRATGNVIEGCAEYRWTGL